MSEQPHESHLTRKRQKMAKRKLVIEIIFEEDFYEDEEYTHLEVIEIRRGKKTDLTEDELDGLGESVAQTDFWQVDRWNDIQEVLGGRKSVKVGK